jgi:hypothetical protein
MAKHGSGYDIANILHRIDTRPKTQRFIYKFAKKEYPIKADTQLSPTAELKVKPWELPLLISFCPAKLY